MRRVGATGAPDGFDAFARAHGPTLQRLAWLMTGDWQAAEDAAQNALARTWLYWGRISSVEARGAYARKVLYRDVAGSRRLRRHGEVPTSEVGSDVPATAGDPAAALDLQRALRSLPTRQRAVVVFRYFDDLTESQTASTMGCSTGTVKSQTSKALTKLRNHPALARQEQAC